MPRLPNGISRSGNARLKPTLSAMKTTRAGSPRNSSMIPVAIHRYGPTLDRRISASTRPSARPNVKPHAV